MQRDARVANEREWSERAAKKLGAGDYRLWDQAVSTHRVVGAAGKRLVIWKLFDGLPKIVNTLTINGVSAQPKTGLCMHASLEGARPLAITHQPQRISDGVFLWLAHYNDLQYTPHPVTGEFDIKFSLLTKTLANPASGREGVEFLNTISEFKSMWPSERV